jgi:chromosome segregation ATPase
MNELEIKQLKEELEAQEEYSHHIFRKNKELTELLREKKEERKNYSKDYKDWRDELEDIKEERDLYRNTLDEKDRPLARKIEIITQENRDLKRENKENIEYNLHLYEITKQNIQIIKKNKEHEINYQIHKTLDVNKIEILKSFLGKKELKKAKKEIEKLTLGVKKIPKKGFFDWS